MPFYKGLTRLATDVLGPINAGATRGAGITAAAGTGLTHPLFAVLFTDRKSPLKREGTPARSVTLAGIAEVSRLLHPVGLGPVSQGPSGGTPSQGPYRS